MVPKRQRALALACIAAGASSAKWLWVDTFDRLETLEKIVELHYEVDTMEAVRAKAARADAPLEEGPEA